MSNQLQKKIIAEIGSVHDGSFGNALKLIELAARCGANVVKFQTHIAAAETLPNAPMPPYFKGEPRFEYFERTGFSLSQWKEISAHCSNLGVSFLSSPFSLEAVDLLENVDVAFYKVPSGEVSNIPLLRHIASTGKPVLLSSGMSNWEELDNAMTALADAPEIVIMQCTSAYPCPPDQVGLNVLEEMADRYKVPVGFSDHTLGSAAAFAAAALGAVSIEKHLTFSKQMYGSDAANAMEPTEFTQFCIGIQDIWAMCANPVDKNDLSAFNEMKKIFEKSIVSRHPLKAGQTITYEDMAFKKPGDGIPARDYETLFNRTIVSDLPANHKFSFEDFL